MKIRENVLRRIFLLLFSPVWIPVYVFLKGIIFLMCIGFWLNGESWRSAINHSGILD